MRQSRFTETQIIGMIKEQEAGMPTAEVFFAKSGDVVGDGVAHGDMLLGVVLRPSSSKLLPVCSHALWCIT